jgi:hypothetical protein
LIFHSDFRAAATIFVSHRLAGIMPFRLIGIDPKHRVISEWRWDGRRVCRSALPWARKHWFSSSLSDVQAEVYRSATCTLAAFVRDLKDPTGFETCIDPTARSPGRIQFAFIVPTP